MTNGEKYKTAAERGAAFDEFCKSQDCETCPLHEKLSISSCVFGWLDLDAKEGEVKNEAH